jgi:hypothetical protein
VSRFGVIRILIVIAAVLAAVWFLPGNWVTG